MPTAMLDQWTDEDVASFYGRNVLFPKSRAGSGVRQRPTPRATSALEAYALRTMSEGDPEFSRYLLRFLRDFSSASNRATVRPLTIMSLATGTPVPPRPTVREDIDRASIIALKTEPEREAGFRVPPFTHAVPEDTSAASPSLEAEMAGRRVA